MELRVVADRLYGLRPDEFTPARDAEAAAAKKAGDTELAAAIKALRRPSATAGWVNSLVRHSPPELDDLWVIGAELRAAQEGAAGDELRRLSHERRRLVGGLIGVVADLASGQDAQLTQAVERDVAATLEAAVSDARAAAAVLSGRLLRALVPGGFDAVDLDGAVALPDELPPVPERPRLRAVHGSTPRRPATEQQEALEGARDSAAVAERAVTKANAALDSATSKADAARSVAEEAERAWTVARDRLAQAEAGRDAAAHDRDAAVRRRDDARRAVDRAEARLKRRRS